MQLLVSLVLGFLLAGAASAGPRIEVLLVHEAERLPMGEMAALPDADEARSRVEARWPALRSRKAWSAPTNLALTWAHLQDPALRAVAREAVGLSENPRVRLYVYLLDGLDGTPTAPVGADFEDFSDGEWHVVHFGSSVMREVGAGAASALVRETLLHELAHTGDDTDCDLVDDPNGPDGEHLVNEVLPPSEAFTEGWADYVAFRAGHASSELSGLPQADPHAPLLRMVSLETIPQGAPSTARFGVNEVDDADYIRFPPTWLDRLSVERAVTVVLLQLEARVGWPAMAAAFRSTQGEDCRTLATFLGALSEDTADLPGIEGAVRVGLGGEVPGLQGVIAGRLPACLAADRPSRPRPPRRGRLVPVPSLPPGCAGLVASVARPPLPVQRPSLFGLHP